MQKSKRAASVSIASSKALGAVNEAEDEREVVDTFHDALTDVRSATYVQGRVWTSTKAGQIVVRDPRSRVLAMVDETERCGYPGCMTVVDNTVWVGYSSGIIKAYSASTIREAPGGEFKRHSGAVHSIVKAGARVFSASADFQILEWTKDFAFVRQLSGHAGGVRSLAVKGSFLLSGSDDGTLRCWNIETGDPLKRVHAHQKGTRVVTSHSDYVWTGGEDGVIQVWDGATFELVATLEEHDGPVTCILAVDNEMWTGSNDRTLCVWSVSDYKLKRRTINHSNFITCIVKVVAHREVSEVWTAGADKTIHVWGWGSPFDSDECQRLREDLSMAQDAFKEQHNALYTKYLKMEGTKDAHIADLNKTIAGQAEDLIRCGDIQADIKKVLGKEHELEDKATEAFKGKQKDLLAALEQLRNSEREAAVKIESLSVTAAQIPQLEEELERARDKRTQMAHQLNKKEAELDAIKLRHMQDSAEAESYKRNTSQDLNELRACIASRDERIKKQNKDLEKRGEELAESEEGRIAALEKIDRLTNELALGNSETHTLKTGNERLEKRLKHLDGAFNQQQQLHESMARSQSAPLSEEHEKLMDTAGQLEADKKILKVKVKELEAQCKQLRELNNKASRGGSVSSGSVEAEDESHVAELERCLFETEEKLSASETDRLEIMKHFSKVQELLAEDTKEVRAWQEEVHTALEFVSPARTEVTLREILVEYKSSQDFLLCLEEAAKAGDAKSVLTLLGERTDVSQLSLFGPVDEERMRDDIAREYDIMLEDMRKEVDTLRQSTDSKSKTAEWVETIAPSPPPPPVPELSIATLNFQNRLQAADKARQEAEREVEELRNKLEATSPDPRGLSEVSRDTEIEALKAKLQLSMETREASRSEMETLSTRLRELENEAFKNEQARESSIQQQLHAAEIEVQELQEQVDVLTSKLTNASDADERLEEELKIREDGMKVLSDQLEKSAPLIEEMREVAAKSSKDLRKKERECEQLRTALDEFVEEREKLFTVNKELKKALTTETARCNELQASMEDAEMQLLEQEQGASEMRELKREVKKEANAALEARQKLEDAEADIEELKKQLEINARKRGEVLELKRKLEEVEEELAVERENKAGSSDALARKLEISEAKTSKKAEELQEARQEIQELEEELRERAGEVSTLRAQVKGAEGVRGNTETKLVELEAQLETAVISKANELRELKRELKREASECTAAKAELTELEEELRERSGEVSTLRAQIKGTEGKRGDAETKLVELETQLEAAVQSESNELRELKRELKKEASECAAAKAELEELEAQLESCAQSEATEIRELKEELRKESSECKAAKAKLEEANARVTDLEEQLEETTQSESNQLRELRRDLTKKTTESMSANVQLESTEAKLAELTEQLELAQSGSSELRELKKELRKETTECMTAKAQLEDAETKMAELEARLEMSVQSETAELRELRKELKREASDCNAAKAKLGETEARLADVETDFEAAGQSASDLSNELRELKKELRKETTECMTAKAQLEDAEAKVAELEAKLEASAQSETAELRELKKELKREASDCNAAKAKLEETEAQLVDMEADFEAAGQSASDVSNEVRELKKELRKETTECMTAKAQLENTEAKVVELQSKLEATAQSETAELRELKKDLKKEAFDCSAAKAKLDEAEAHLADLEAQLEAAVQAESQVSSELRDLKKELKKETTECMAAKAELEDAAAMVAEFQSQLEATAQSETAELRELKRELKKEAFDCSAAKARLEETEAHLADLEAQLEAAVQAESKVSNEVRDLKKELRKETTECMAAKAELEDTGARVAEVEAKLEASAQSETAELRELRKELKKEASDCSVAKAKLEEAEARLADLEAELEAAVQMESKMSNEVRELKKELRKETTECMASKAQLDETETRVADLEALLETSVQSESSEMRELKKELRKEASEHMGTKTKLEDAEADIEELKKQLEINARKRGEVLELKRKLEEVEEELAVERENKAGSSDALARKLEISEAKTSKKAEELQEARQEIQELEEELRERAGEVSTLRAQVKGAEGVRGNTETKLVELEAQLETAVISKANELRELKRELKREASECTAAKAELTELEEELRERSGEVSTLRAQVKEVDVLREQAHTLQAQLTEVEKVTQEVPKLKAEVTEHHSRAAEACGKVIELEATLAELQSETAEVSDLKKELLEAKEAVPQLAEVEANLESVKEEKTVLEEKVEVLQAELEESVVSKKKLEVTHEQVQALETEIRDCSEEIDYLKEQIRQHEANAASSSSRMQVLEKEAHQVPNMKAAAKEAAEQIEDLTFRLDQKEASSGEVKDLKKALRKESLIVTELKQQLEDAEVDSAELQKQLEIALKRKTQTTDLKIRLEEAEEELAVEKAKRKGDTSSQRKCQVLENDLVSKEEELRNLEHQKQEMHTKLSLEAEALRVQLKEAEDATRALPRLKHEAGMCAEHKARADDAEAKLLELELQLETKTLSGSSEMRELKKELRKEASEHMGTRTKLEDAEADIEELKKQLEINARKRGEVLELKRKLEEVEEELAVERENKAGSSDALARKLEISEAKTSKKAEELQEARQEIQELEEELRERAGEVSTLRAQVKGAEGVRGNTETKLVELEAQLETAVISKANELRELKRELKREASECTAAKAELTELEEELRERSGEVSTLRAQIKGTEGKRGDAETKLVELETQLEAAVQSESNELRELKRELKKEASECAAAKAELEELEAQLESCAQSEATEIRELKEELRKESSECKAVKGELEELEAQLEACAQSEAAEMRDLRMELERETSARRATKTELRELEAQLEAKEHEAVVIDELREELNREVSECKKVRAELQELEQQLGMSKEMDLQLREELVNKTSECAAAKTELQEIHKLLKNTQSETTELHKLKSELSNEANEREVAQTQLEASAGEIREKLQEIEDLRQNLCDLKEAAEEPKSKLEEAETAVEDLRKKLEETEEKLASERANKGEHNVLVERLEASENRAERKARELGEARQEVEELEEELHESASEVNTLAEELKAAKDILKGRESEIQGLRREYTEAESGALDVEAVAAEKTQLEGMLEDALKKIATSETYIEELEKALEVSKVRKDELDELRDRLEEAVRVAEDEDREVGSVMRDRLSAKDKAHKDLQLELETTEQQRDQYREQAAEYQNKVTQLEGKLMELKLELDTSRENDPEEVQDLREKLLKETTKTDKLKQSLSDADSAIKELRMNLTEAATKRAADADAKTERRKLNETHLSIDQGDAQGETAKQLKDALLEIRVLEDELQESVCEMESLRGQIVGGGGTPEKSRIMDERDTMQLKVRQLEEELQEANNEVDDLKSQLTETEDALRDARSQRGDPSVEGIVQHDLAGKLRRSEAKIRSLDEENNKVTRQLDDLISRFKKTDEMLQRKQDECTALGEEVEALKHTDVNQQLDILTQQLMETEAKMEQFQQNSQEDLVQRLQTSERELRNELRQRPHEADVQAQIELANERVVDLETELSKASEEKQELEDEIARLHNHLENSDQLCDEKQGEINKLCADYETMRNEREMTSHGSTMSPPRTDREGDVQKLKETIKEQEAYIKMLEDPSEYRGVGYEAEQQEWKLRHDQLEDVVAELRGSLADAELQAETNNQTAEDYKTIAKEMTGKADIAEDACRDVAEQIALLKEDKEHLKTQMIAMKSQLGANRESDDSARVAALQAKLATSNELVAQLRKTIAEFKSKNMFLTIDKNQLVDRFAEAESKVTNLKDHAIALKQRLSVAKKESQQKEVEILQWKQKCDSVTNELSLIQSGSPTPIKHVHHSSHDSMLPLPVWEDGDQLKRRNDELQEMTDAYQQQLRVNTKLRQELEELEEKQVMAGQADNMSKEQSDALRNIAAILRSKTLELEADATAISELNDERSKVKADFKKMENLLRMERLSSREDEELLKSLKSAFELDTTKLDNKSVELKASIKRLQAAYAHVLNLVKNTDVKGDDKDIENAALKCVVQLVADQMKTKESKYRQLQDRFTEMAEFPHRNVSPQRSVSPRRCMEPGWGEVLTDVTDIFGKVQDLRPVTDPYGINEVEKLEEFCGGLVIKYSIGLNDLRDRPADPNCDRNHSESCPVPGRISPRPPRDYPTTPTIHTIAATAAYPRDPPPSQTSPPSLNRLVSMAF